MGQKISVSVDFIGSFEQMNKGVQDLQKNLSKLNLPLNEQKDFDNLIKSFQKAYGQIASMSKDGTIDIIDEKVYLGQIIVNDHPVRFHNKPDTKLSITINAGTKAYTYNNIEDYSQK